jgi:hypothetical protein
MLSIKTFKIEIFPIFFILPKITTPRSLYEKTAGNFQDSKKEVMGAISFDKAFRAKGRNDLFYLAQKLYFPHYASEHYYQSHATFRF